MRQEKEKKRKFGILYLILIIIFALFITLYLQNTIAQYRSNAIGEAEAEIAEWHVLFKGSKDADYGATYNTSFIPVYNSYVKANKIAPNMTANGEGNIKVEGTETAIDFSIEIGTLPTELLGADFEIEGVEASNNRGTISMVKDGNKYSGTVLLPAVTETMTSDDNITFIVTAKWNNDITSGTTDTPIGEAGGTISIPITVTAVQKQ